MLTRASHADMPVIPDSKNIRSFRTQAAFEKWLAANHDRELFAVLIV